MIPAALLRNYKVLAIMINIPFKIRIFAASSGGSEQRRGTTHERLRTDMGRHLVACLFDLSKAQSLRAPPYFFLGLFRAFFWGVSGLFFGVSSLKRAKCYT